MSDTRSDPARDLQADTAWVRRLARSLAADLHGAEDLAQEAWVAALARPGGPPEPEGERRAWLAGVLRNIASKSRRGAARRAGREQRAARPEAADPAADLVARAALHRDLVDAVMALDEPFRSAVLLRYLEDLPPRAIARRLGLPARTVASRLARGRAELRARLDAQNGGREAWLPALVALGGRGASTVGTSGGTLMMGTMKVAVAAALAWGGLFGVRELMGHKADAPIEVASAAESIERAQQEPGPLAEPPDARARAAVAAPGAQAAQAAGTLVLRGRVIDAACPDLGLAEGPAAGVKVRVQLNEKGQPSSALGGLGYLQDSPPPAGEALAVDGTFSFELKDPGYRPLFFQARCEGSSTHRSASADGVVQGSGQTSAEVVVVRPPFGVLHGVVRDEAGAPVKGARVSSSRRGEPAVEAQSDAEGRFSLAAKGEVRRIEASAAGFAPLVVPSPHPRADGGYDEAEVVLCAAGRLVVRLMDARQQPLGGAMVRLQLAPEELPAGSARDWSSARREVARQADAAGMVEFPDAWLGRKLLIHLKTAAGDVHYDKVDGGRLARTQEASGQALVIPPDGVLEVEAVAPSEMLVHLAVRFPDGSPVPSPGYGIDEVERAGTAGVDLARGTGDAAGNIEARVMREQTGGEIAVYAMDAVSARSGQPYHAARLVLDAARAGPSPEASGGVLTATLVLQPTYSISGRLVDQEGQPVVQDKDYRVFAVPAGSKVPVPLTEFSREAWTRAEKGEFLITGLVAGNYDLYAPRQFEASSSSSAPELVRGADVPAGMARVADVPAGTAGLDIVITSHRDVRVRLLLHGAHAGRTPKELLVLVGAFEPSDGRTPPASSPPRIRSAGLAAWPKDAPWGFRGASATEQQGGWFQYASYSTQDLEEHAVPELAAGWYVFGVQPTDGDPTHFPCATDLVYLRPGEYEVTFDLVPAAPLRGRITGEGSVGHLAVALVDAGDRLLPQHQPDFMFGAMTTRLSLNAAGEFSFPAAPIGRRTLRVGTPAELGAGSFQREFEVEVTAEPGEPLVLRL